MTTLLPEDHSVDSLQADLLRDAVALFCGIEDQSEQLHQAVENLVYTLNQHWVDQHGWELTLTQEVG